MQDHQIDAIYDFVDEEFKAGRFWLINDLLYSLINRAEFLDTDFILTYLTTTLCAKDKLSNRKILFNRIKRLFDERHGNERPGLLQGLE